MAKPEWDYPLIIKTYNEEGSRAAVVLLGTRYGMKNPYSFLKRMKLNKDNQYNQSEDKFRAVMKTDGLFLGLDELCNKPKSAPPVPVTHNTARQPSLSALMQELIQEKLLELTKYMQLNRAMNTVSVDKSALISDGYNVIIL